MDASGSQGDHMMARKLAKQQSMRTVGRHASAASAGVLQSVPSLALSMPRVSTVLTESPVPHGNAFVPNAPPTSVQLADMAENASTARQKHMQRHNIDASQQRQAVYDAWPDDKHYLQQQLSLIRQELMEKDEQLQRAHTDIRLLNAELEKQRCNFDSEIYKVKSENLAQLIHTFQTEGLRGVEGLAKMQQSGVFHEGKEKERQRVYELERGMVQDLGVMRQEYEGKLGDMQCEYRARLGWLAHQQSCLEAQQQQKHDQQQQNLMQQHQQQMQYAMSPRSQSGRSVRSHSRRSVTSRATPYGKAMTSSQSSSHSRMQAPHVKRLSEVP
eukprot:TRINITY_DN17136_c0_g1_i1.p1 TRINITY_DN17136_c0_g1~~TRINITY_DN17136_c0_g1_i1.p1  ORF type:complete len:360 (+),score=122.92 TRINITY_DN17136_c0_g1_i1:99-1082(+)